MNVIIDFILSQNLIFIVPCIAFIYGVYLLLPKIRTEKNVYWKALETMKYFIYSVQMYILIFVIFFILLQIVSPEYRAGGTSGLGMGPAFSHGIMVALYVFLLLPISFIVNAFVQYIQSKLTH